MRRWKTLLLSAATATAALAVVPSMALADLDCSDFTYQEEAQEHLLPGDPHRLDADDDGVACESLPPEPPPPDETGNGLPPKLNKAAARRAAKRKAKRFARNNRRVDRASFAGCRRRSRHKVVCRFVARGRTPRLRTTCRLRVVVRGEGSRADAKIAKVRCRSRRIAA